MGDFCEKDNEASVSINCVEFLEYLRILKPLTKDVA